MPSVLLKRSQAVALICISMIINEVGHLSLGLVPGNQLRWSPGLELEQQIYFSNFWKLEIGDEGLWPGM